MRPLPEVHSRGRSGERQVDKGDGDGAHYQRRRQAALGEIGANQEQAVSPIPSQVDRQSPEQEAVRSPPAAQKAETQDERGASPDCSGERQVPFWHAQGKVGESQAQYQPSQVEGRTG